MINFESIISKIAIINKIMFTTKKGVILVPTALTIPIVLNNESKAIVFLLFLMFLDFITGIGASFSIVKRYRKENPTEPKKSIISSEKLRRSGVKFLLYLSSILVAYGIQLIFQIDSFNLPTIGLKFNVIIFIIAFWSVAEIYSIFFENFKEMGIDIKMIIKKITNLYTFFKEKSDKICNNEKN